MAENKEAQKTPEETTPEQGSSSAVAQQEEKQSQSTPSAKDLKPGMTVRVYQKIKELNMKKEEKERIQYFEGIIIAKKHNSESGGSITLRRTANGIGVEKVFPLNLPSITDIELKKQAKTRQSKMYFLKKGYKKKLKEKKLS